MLCIDTRKFKISYLPCILFLLGGVGPEQFKVVVDILLTLMKDFLTTLGF